MSLPQELTVRVHDEGTDGLWAEVVELPGCFAAGDNLEELQESLREALELYLNIKVQGTQWGAATDTVEEHRVLIDA